MKAARLHGPRDVRIEQVPDPAPGPGEVLLRVRAVAVCPSDWRLWESGNAGGAPLERPIIQGHEFSGEVVALGPQVEGIAVGARVAVEPSWNCGRCHVCRSGRQHVCPDVVFPSFPPHNGALAEYIACPAFAVHGLPDNLGLIEGALVEPLGVAIHAVRLAQVTPQTRVAVLGAGMVGLCAARLVRLAGVEECAVVEPIPERRELVRDFAPAQVAASYEELVAAGFEPEVVLECAGVAGTIEQSMELAAPCGRVVVVGIPQPETVSFEAFLPRRKELTLIFSRRSRDTLAEAVEMAASGELDLGALPVLRHALEQTSEAIEATATRRDEMLRCVVEP